MSTDMDLISGNKLGQQGDFDSNSDSMEPVTALDLFKVFFFLFVL